MKRIGDIILTTKSTFERLRGFENDAGVLTETFLEEQYYWLVEELRPDTIAIDVGANMGDSAIYFAMQPDIAKVYAYEPYPNLYEKLKSYTDKSIRKSKIEIFNMAVSKPNSDYSFNIKDTIASADTPLMEGNGKSIHAVGLDKIINQIDGNSPIIIKMDCEGGEFVILNKGLDLSKVYRMQIEVHEKLGNITSLEAILNDYGFKTKTGKEATDMLWLYAWK